MGSGGNNQSDVDDLLVEEYFSDGKESGSLEEGDQLVNRVSDLLDFRNAVACHLIGHQLERKK